MTTKEQKANAQAGAHDQYSIFPDHEHMVRPGELKSLLDDQEEFNRWKALIGKDVFGGECVQLIRAGSKNLESHCKCIEELRAKLSTVKLAADEMCSQAKVYLSECNCKSFDEDKLLGDSIASYSVATKDIV